MAKRFRKKVMLFTALLLLETFTACKQTQFSNNDYKKGADRVDGTGGKDKILQNSAFGTDDVEAVTNQPGDDSNDVNSNNSNEVDTTDPNAPASLIDVIRMCSNNYSTQAGTNVKSARGIIASLFPITKSTGTSTGQSVTVDFSKKPIVFKDPQTAERLRRDIVLAGKFKLPLGKVPSGTYQMILCDADKSQSCLNQAPNAAQSSRFLFGGETGQVGTAMITVSKGRMTSLQGAGLKQSDAMTVLTDRNAEQQAVMANFGSFFSMATAAQGGPNLGSIFPPVSQEALQGLQDCDDNASPLMIDLANTGISLTSLKRGVSFDIDADGEVDQISWPLAETSVFVVLDINGNGSIDNGGELFGNNSIGPDTHKAANGFLALSKYDSNGDGYINDKDPVFTKLRLWSDKNRDGISTPLELLTLIQAGITSIDLTFKKGRELDIYGNSTRQRSVVNLQNGQVRLIVDIWFRKM